MQPTVSSSTILIHRRLSKQSGINLTISDYLRIQVGEGLEAVAKDGFAEEVAKMAGSVP